MHDRKKLQKLWNQIPGEGWLHSPVLQVQRVKWRSSSLVWLAVEVAAVNEEEEPQYILLDLWTHQHELLICSSGQDGMWLVSVEEMIFLPLFWVTTWCSTFASGIPHFLYKIGLSCKPLCLSYSKFHLAYLSAMWHMSERANTPWKITLQFVTMSWNCWPNYTATTPR